MKTPVLFFNLSFDTHYIIMAVVEVTVNKPLCGPQPFATFSQTGLYQKHHFDLKRHRHVWL